MSVLDMAALFL